MTKQKIFQFNLELFKTTGIQRVLLDIHEALKDDYDCRIVGNIAYNEIDNNLSIPQKDYERIRNPFIFRNSIVIIHERRLLPLMWILTHFPGLNVKCVYVHHNELIGHKALSLFPQNIVAISNAGIKNLIEYFRIPKKNITKIHNCVREVNIQTNRVKTFDPNDIKILYPARINNVKQQIEIVQKLRGKLDPHIKILFAGTGPNYDKLNRMCEGDTQFIALGFRDDIPQLMSECDFVLLFSKHEGLPISLIEAIGIGMPVICNNVGGNNEIISDGINGIIVNDWDNLIKVLNSLPTTDPKTIKRMSEEGKRIYSERFTFDVFKNKYNSLIDSLKS